MPERWQSGDWLLMDAAGPCVAAGWLRDNKWLDLRLSSPEQGVLDFIPQSIGAMLKQQGRDLHELEGFIYGTGPGSTLGLRLVALMLRAWQQTGRARGRPAQQVLAFNHLQVAHATREQARQITLAPWRRDRVHACEDAGSGHAPRLFALATDALPENCRMVQLGARPPAFGHAFPVVEFPLQSFPEIIANSPWLIESADIPAPYVAEQAEYAPWVAKRHAATS